MMFKKNGSGGRPMPQQITNQIPPQMMDMPHRSSGGGGGSNNFIEGQLVNLGAGIIIIAIILIASGALSTMIP